MLQLKNIRKAYVTPAFTQVALDDVSLSFRDNEFAAILGPSGSGKTTLLNILGGLDHADSGEIVINGVSTKDYGSRDWDTYRNHRIGFIFQSYNLIAHQSVVANVEMALTLAGKPPALRRKRAMKALERVGLAEHATKRPNQLSGGQMQRVAIARALVNDPDIVLADEPTGALDTETGLQVMSLLEEIARDRLVVMVTHNPELAEQYATRIIRLTDGKVTSDTNPLVLGGPPQAGKAAEVVAPLPVGDGRGEGTAHRVAGGGERGTRRRPNQRRSDTTRHASMSFLTALALSFNNLMTKKGRTFMTAFAGSIGIIGIAAILALSNGVNAYIADTEEEALLSYPITITKSSFDMTSLVMAGAVTANDEQDGTVDGRVLTQQNVINRVFSNVKSNDLRAFKAFLESGESGIDPYVNSIRYSYGLNPLVYKGDTSDGVVRLNPSRMSTTLSNGISGSAFLGGQSMSSFYELPADQRLIDQSLELVEGRMPQRYDECAFVLGRSGGVTDYTLYSLGFYDIKVMEDMLTKALNGEEVTVPETSGIFTLDDALSMHFSVVVPPQLYQKNEEQGTWTDMTGDKAYMRKLLTQDAVDLHVVGVFQRNEKSSSAGVVEGIAYTPELTMHLMEQSQQSQIVKEQLARPSVDVFTGKTFEELQDEESRNLDMESVFSVDEDALREAFSFDTSALEGLGQGMDLSGLDLGSALAGMDLSGLDLSGLKLDMSSLGSLFNEDQMRQIMQNAPQFSGEGLDLSSISLDLTDEQRQRLGQAAASLVEDFVSWLVQSGALDGGDAADALPDFASLVQQYLESDSAQAIISDLLADLSLPIDSDTAQKVAQVLRDYLTESLVPYLTAALENVDLSQLDEEKLRQILASMPSLDVSALGELIGLETVSELAGKTAAALAADFSSWLLQHPDLIAGATEEGSAAFEKMVTEYLKTDSAKKITSSLLGELGEGLGDDVSKAIGSAMSSYMTNQFAPYIARQFESVFATLAQNLGKQLGTALAQQIAAQMNALMGTMGSAISSQLASQMGQLTDALQGGFSVDVDAFSRAIQFNMTQEDLASLLTNFMKADELTYEANLVTLGFAEEENPQSISLYPIDFPAKEVVVDIVDDYNARMRAEGMDDSTIQYSDVAGLLMSSVTSIVNNISTVMIATVSISLVVSSIMISIITYISVLERRKEIGILRAMGASKLNIANIFNAETVIEGFFAGVLAVTVVLLASVPINEYIYATRDVPQIMKLLPENALALVAVSVALTLVAGLIPSSAAAHRDPVEALRSE